MNYIFFSKSLREQSVPQLVTSVKKMGMDGIDMAVRDGYPVSPANVRRALPEAAKRCREEGVPIRMISLPTDFHNPDSRIAEDVWSACHDAQILLVKIGYWGFNPAEGYWKQVIQARKQLDKFHILGMRFGIRTLLHTHSGANLGLNASSAMHLAEGYSQFSVGIYLDPGHLALNGEPLGMAFDMVSEHLAAVAVKDSLWKKEAGKSRHSEFVPLGQGMVEWREMAGSLKKLNFVGPLSFHSEYADMPADKIIEQTAKDVAFIKGLG